MINWNMIKLIFFQPCSLDIKIQLNFKQFALNIFLLFITLAVVESITGNSYSFTFLTAYIFCIYIFNR
jgi:hypothetical protein